MRLILEPELNDYFARVDQLAREYCIFFTTEGFIGLGRYRCEPGDTVSIIGGASTSLLSRATEAGNEPQHYRIVGEAYVDGIMDGQY